MQLMARVQHLKHAEQTCKPNRRATRALLPTVMDAAGCETGTRQGEVCRGARAGWAREGGAAQSRGEVYQRLLEGGWRAVGGVSSSSRVGDGGQVAKKGKAAVVAGGLASWQVSWLALRARPQGDGGRGTRGGFGFCKAVGLVASHWPW